MNPVDKYIPKEYRTDNWDAKTVEAKRSLNLDFKTNARLPNSVRVYHYIEPLGHAAVSVSGQSYGFYPGGFLCKENPLDKEIQNAKTGGIPIWEAKVAITPERLLPLEKMLDESKSYACLDCSEAVCRLLLQQINPKVSILPPLSLCPALVRWKWSKLVDNKHVFPGIYHENSSKAWFSANTIHKINLIAECSIMATFGFFIIDILFL